MTKPTPDQLINELLSIEAYADQLRQRCYNARKSLESFYSPASEGKRKKRQPNAACLKVLAKRRSTVLRSLNT